MKISFLQNQCNTYDLLDKSSHGCNSIINDIQAFLKSFERTLNSRDFTSELFAITQIFYSTNELCEEIINEVEGKKEASLTLGEKIIFNIMQEFDIQVVAILIKNNQQDPIDSSRLG